MGPLGLLVVHLFVGPPILIQVVTLEQRALGDAWAGTRDLLAGHWGRIVMYLLNVAIVAGIVPLVLLSSLELATRRADDMLRLGTFTFLQSLLLGLLVAYLALVQVVCYLDLRERRGADAGLDEEVAATTPPGAATPG